MKQYIQKKNVVNSKTPFFAKVHFVHPITFILTLASDKAVWYRNLAFLISVLTTKRSYSSLLKKVVVFQKFVSKLWNRSEFPVLSHKTMRVYQTQGYFKSSCYTFRRTYALSFDFKKNSLRKKRFPVIRQKPTQILL